MVTWLHGYMTKKVTIDCRVFALKRPYFATEGNEDWLLPVHLVPAIYWLRRGP